MIMHGDKQIQRIFHGDKEIIRAYQGDSLVFRSKLIEGEDYEVYKWLRIKYSTKKTGGISNNLIILNQDPISTIDYIVNITTWSNCGVMRVVNKNNEVMSLFSNPWCFWNAAQSKVTWTSNVAVKLNTDLKISVVANAIKTPILYSSINSVYGVGLYVAYNAGKVNSINAKISKVIINGREYVPAMLKKKCLGLTYKSMYEYDKKEFNVGTAGFVEVGTMNFIASTNGGLSVEN